MGSCSSDPPTPGGLCDHAQFRNGPKFYVPRSCVFTLALPRVCCTRACDIIVISFALVTVHSRYSRRYPLESVHGRAVSPGESARLPSRSQLIRPSDYYTTTSTRDRALMLHRVLLVEHPLLLCHPLPRLSALNGAGTNIPTPPYGRLVYRSREKAPEIE